MTQTIIIDAIKSAWEESEKGVIIGSLDFDKVGSNPHSGYEAVKALGNVVDEVGISAQDVTVIVSYRSPRTDHWGSVWWNHFEAETYQDFVCSDEQSDKRWEWLDTTMNPFMVAKAYHDQEFNVGVLDQDSILKAGKNVTHAIACYAMGDENCEDGWIAGIDREVPDPLEVFELDLSEDDLSNLEKMFLFRDCYYVSQFEDSSRFEMVSKDSGFGMIQSECNDALSASYEKLAKTNFLFNAIQSQEGCATKDVDIESVLNGIVPDTDDDDDGFVKSSSTSKPTDNGTGDSTEADNDASEKSSATSSPSDSAEASATAEPIDTSEKKLIVFAGPRETSGTSVTKFFANHDSSLGGWAWPTVDSDSEVMEDTEPHHTFDHLVKDADSKSVQNTIMDGVRGSWNKANTGVIIGSTYFGRVGKNPESGYDPLGAIDRVVETLDVSNEKVTIALNYRSSRVDHLSAVWWNHFESYTLLDFICSDHEEEKRWEWIDTVMNPLKVANAYTDQGWNVAVIEQEGTSSAGKDVSHSLACHLMDNVDCQNDWVLSLTDETTPTPNSYEIAGFDDRELSELDNLFLMRDCFYKYKLESNNKFSTVNRKHLWKSCSSRSKDAYEQLTDTDFLIDVMKSLQGCDDGVDPKAWDFASKYSRPPMSDRTLTIVIVLSLAVFAFLVATLLKMKLRRRMKQKSIAGPPEGIFKDDPPAESYSDAIPDYGDDEENGELETVLPQMT